jgi:hypothetical protein
VRLRGRDAAPRDQRESAFSAILGDLVSRVPGARSATLVDRDGETVDYAGHGNPYAIRVAAAHFRIVFDEAIRQPSLGAARSVLVRASRASFALHSLPDGYALVLGLSRGAGFRGLVRAVPVCIRLLADEAGWAASPSPWHPLDVLLDERRTPRAVRPVARLSVAPASHPPASAASRGSKRPRDPAAEPAAPDERGEPQNAAVGAIPLEILGRFRAALPEHERAWRVRTQGSPLEPASVDFTLVRESNGFWYADEPVIPWGDPRNFRKRHLPKEIL